MTDPRQVIRILAYRGVTVRLDHGHLIAGPRHLLYPEVRRLIAPFRAEMIAYLEAERAKAGEASETSPYHSGPANRPNSATGRGVPT